MSNDRYNTGDFSFWLEDASADKSITIENDPDYPNGYKAKIFGENKLVFTNNGKTIKMGSNGDKTLGTGGGDNTTVTLDFGTVTDPNAYALEGHLFLGGWGSGIVNGTFGGKGIKGNVILKGGNNNLTFNDGATFTRDLNISNGNNVVTFKNVGSIGGIDTTGGNNTFVFENDVRTNRIWGKNGVNSFTFNGNATISSGSEVIYGGFYNGSYHGQNTYVFKGTENKIESTNTSNKIAIQSNGNDGSSTLNTFHHLTFENATGTNTIIGKISAITNTNRGDRSAKNTIIFSGSGATNTITGDITADNYGQNHLTFRGANNTITGNISTGWGGTTAISFEGSGTQTSQITGGISTYRNSTTISFEGQESATITGGSISSDRTLEDGGNFITFSNNGNATINIEGYKISSENAQNVILFENNTTQTITADEISAATKWEGYPNKINTITFIGQEGSESTITANITASDGVNNISFQGSGTQSIVGNMNTSSTYAVDTRNVISFSGETASITGNITSTDGSNSITFSGENSTNTITGNISATSGSNSITFSGENSTNIITGNISGTNNITLLGESNTLGGELQTPSDSSDPIPYSISANGGRNNIIATNLTFKNIGTITAGSNGNEAKNLFDISGDTKIIGSDLVITAYNRDNTNTVKYNIFKFGGDIIVDGSNPKELAITELSAISVNGDFSKTKNILSFDGLTSTLTLNITDINKSETIDSKRTGYNYIGKSLTTGSGSSLDFNSGFTNNTWDSQDYQADVNLGITNAVLADGGNNYFNVKNITITNGGLTSNNGGMNLFNSDSITLNGDIIVNGASADTGHNVLVTKTLTLSSSDSTGSTPIAISADGSWLAKNLLDISESIILNNSLVVKADNTINTNRESYNIIKLAGTIEGAIDELRTTTKNSGSFTAIDKTKNILSFDGSGENNLTIGVINDSTHIGEATGYTYIGKNLTTGSGYSLNLDNNFSDSNWDSASYQASSLTLEVTGDIYSKSGKNYINVASLTAGSITATDNGSNNIALGSGSVNGSISGTTNLTLLGNDSTLTLNGVTSGGTTHQITSLKVAGSNATLTLDNSSVTSDAMTTTIDTVTNGEKLAVVLDSKGENEGVSLSFTNATALKSVTLAGAEGNALTFNTGANSITEKINVGSTQDLALNLAGATTSLNLAGGLSGGAVIDVNSSNATTLSGGVIDGASLTLASGTDLTLKNTSATFTAVDASAGSTTLKLDGTKPNATANAVNATINSLKGGNNLAVAFNGRGEGSGATLKINGVDSGTSLTLASISLENNSTNNTLDLSNLADSVTSVNFGGNGIVVGDADNRQGLSIKVKGLGSNNARAITFTNGLTTTNGVSTLAILDGNATLSATANGINLTNLDISANNTSSTVTFLSSATIGSLTAQADKGSNLVVGNANDKTTQTQTAYFLTIGSTNSTLNSVTLEGYDTTTLTINGGTQTINTLTLNASENKLTLSNKNNLTIGEIVNGGNSFNVELTDSTLSLAGDTNKIDSLVTDGKSVINLAVGHIGSNVVSKAGDKPARNTLTIGELNGDLNANIFVSKTQADKIVINDATNAGGSADTLTLYARGNAGEIISITREDNVLVADTSGAVTTNSKKVDVIGGISDIGGLVVALTVEQEIDDITKKETGKWYVGKTEVKGVDTSFQEVASSALAVNYDLYLANFNSLNKRMGELRDNAHNQGVWARVFGGAMSNDIGSGSKTQYVTAQAGYDYSLTLGNARNYMGVALAYGSSVTKANEGVGLTKAFLDNINSQMVEVGIYNSYVMDSGWYNDTIFKFDYIMSDFDISVQSGGTSSHSTNNFAMVLSDEFGYRYKFAESEKGNWYIDPQVEVAFGYFNQSDFNQAIADNFATVEASQDSILTLRTRAGMSLGKKFNTAKGFASLYVGAFYEYDYIEGGNAQTQVLTATNSIDRVESNGRAIVNVGSNIELTDGVRMYIDVEKSFGDKQRTDMQFNFGARYSFGEATPTLSHHEQYKAISAPLKVDGLKDHKDDEESKNDAEESKNTEKEDSKSK